MMARPQYAPAENAALRKADFDHHRCMVRGSAMLRDRILVARGLEPIGVPANVMRKIDKPVVVPFVQPMEVRKARNFIVIGDILAAVAEEMGVTVEDITGRKRKKMAMQARMVAYAVMARRGASLTVIGKRIGGRNHSTVINGLRRFEHYATPWMRTTLEKLAPEAGR